MTNKEYLNTLSSEEWYQKVDWLMHKYALGFTHSQTAIVEWLGQEYKESNNDK